MNLLGDTSAVRLISHRGESLDAPENTMAAFRLAAERKTGGFECDIYRTADDEIAVIHDATTTRTTGTNLTVATSMLAQLRALDAGSWKGAQFAGERIPTLSEALSLAHDGFEIYVEIKCGTEILPRLREVLASTPEATPERVVFIGFSTNVIGALRQQLPAYRAYWLSNLSTNASGGLVPSAASVIATLQATGANGVDVQDHAALDAGYVSAIKTAGASFHVWTVDSAPRVVALAALGVDSITSDCAAVLAAQTAAASSTEPLIHWTFDNTATNSGSVGSICDATLHGSPVYTNGIAGRGLWLDGVDDFASVAYPLTSQGTIALWYKPELFYNYNSVFDNSVGADQWEMWIYSDGRLRARINNTGSTGDITYDNLVSKQNGSNHWYHIAYVWDNTSNKVARLYVNGVEQGAAAIANWVAPGASFYIGGGNSGNTKGKGVVDDVRVYNAALTAAQIQALHAEAAARAPVVHLALDGTVTNSGTGGARYDAALSGGPVWTNGWNNKGQALALYRTNDLASVLYRMPASGSVALWYYVPGPWYNYNEVFDNSGDKDNYECWIDNSGKLYFRPTAASTASYSLGSGSNRWYHIVGTWDALSSNVVLYVNGVERGRGVNTSGSAWPVAGSNLLIGGGNAGNTNGTGIASDVQIFETPLSSNRVTEVYGEFGQHGGLVAYLPLDGTAADVAGSNAVVVTGSASFVKAQIGKGLSYTPAATPGTGGSCVSVSNALGSSVGTIAFWYYARGPWYNYQPLMDNSAGDNCWESWIYSDGRLAARVNSGTLTYDLDNLRGSNSWYHVAFTWDRAAQQTQLYVDGVLRATSALTDAGWVNSDRTLRIGSVWASNSAANGVWDEVRVYDRALTAEEIAALTLLPSKGTVIRIQ